MGMKKLAALVMALMLCLTAVSAMAATNVSTFAEFKAAVENSSVDEIKVTADILDGEGVVFKQTKTIDFGGHTYNFKKNAVGSTGTTTLGFQLLKESGSVTLKNGTLTSTSGSGIKRLIQNYTDLKLVDMTLDGSKLDEHAGSSAGTPNATVSFCNGTCSILGDTTIIADDNGKDIAFGVYDYSSNGYTGVEVTVNTDGEIVGEVTVSADDATDADAKMKFFYASPYSTMSLTVSEGTAVISYVPQGTKIVNENGDVDCMGDSIGKGEDVTLPDMQYNDKKYKGDYVYKGKGSVTFESTADLSTFEAAVVYDLNKVDEYEVIAQVYKEGDTLEGDLDLMTIRKGSIAVDLHESFLKTLPVGKYGLAIYSTKGDVEGEFTVAPADVVADLPQTGDNSSLLMWASLLALAAAGFVVSRKTRLN